MKFRKLVAILVAGILIFAVTSLASFRTQSTQVSWAPPCQSICNGLVMTAVTKLTTSGWPVTLYAHLSSVSESGPSRSYSTGVNGMQLDAGSSKLYLNNVLADLGVAYGIAAGLVVVTLFAKKLRTKSK